jgi:beta-lactamase class A
MPILSRYLPIVLLASALTYCQSDSAPKDPDFRSLERSVRDKVDLFNGDAGVYIRHLPTGSEIAINADTVFPTASMVKVPILVALFDKIEKGELEYREQLYHTGDHDYGAFRDVISNMADSSVVYLDMLIHLMMSASNNTASLWNQHLAGGGDTINAWLEGHGFEHTRVNSRTPGREDDWSRYGWGQTTPREMAGLVTMIYRGEAVNPHASEKMYRIMTRNFWDGEALSQIPPYVNVASKNGAVSRSRSEVLLVNAPSGDYVLCIITKNQDDATWEFENEGWVLARSISRAVWQAFEPADTWEPDERVARY